VIRTQAAPSDRDGWIAHVLVAVFGVLVAAMLGVVRGWSTPLHAWIVLAALVDAVLALHATVQAVLRASRRRWRDAAFAVLLALGLGGTAGGLRVVGHAMRIVHGDDVLFDAPMDAPEAATTPRSDD
jgi:hypothetical protein